MVSFTGVTWIGAAARGGAPATRPNRPAIAGLAGAVAGGVAVIAVAKPAINPPEALGAVAGAGTGGAVAFMAFAAGGGAGVSIGFSGGLATAFCAGSGAPS